MIEVSAHDVARRDECLDQGCVTPVEFGSRGWGRYCPTHRRAYMQAAKDRAVETARSARAVAARAGEVDADAVAFEAASKSVQHREAHIKRELVKLRADREVQRDAALRLAERLTRLAEALAS